MKRDALERGVFSWNKCNSLLTIRHVRGCNYQIFAVIQYKTVVFALIFSFHLESTDLNQKEPEIIALVIIWV